VELACSSNIGLAAGLGLICLLCIGASTTRLYSQGRVIDAGGNISSRCGGTCFPCNQRAIGFSAADYACQQFVLGYRMYRLFSSDSSISTYYSGYLNVLRLVLIAKAFMTTGFYSNRLFQQPSLVTTGFDELPVIPFVLMAFRHFPNNCGRFLLNVERVACMRDIQLQQQRQTERTMSEPLEITIFSDYV